MSYTPEKRKKYLKKCRERISGAKKFREDEGYDALWERMTDLYRGKHFDKITTEDRIAVNRAFSNINTIWSSVSTNYPQISVNARLAEEAERAKIAEATVNYWWRTKGVKPEVQLALKESLIIGHGWLKTGYKFVEEPTERSQEDIMAELAQRQQEVDSYASQNPELADQLPTDEELLANISTTQMTTVEDSPFVERVSPFDMYVDPEATSLRDARWIAQRVYRPLEEVKTDKKYKGSARSRVEADSSVDESMKPSKEKAKDKEHRRCSVYEYYDLKNGTMSVFTELGDDFLVDPIDQPYAFGHPFVYVPDYDVPGYFYTMGELEAIADLQDELNKTRSQMLNHRKKGARKYAYDPRAFSDKAIGDLMSDTDGVAVPINDGVELDKAIIPLPTNGIDQGLYQWSDEIKQDMDGITGVSEYQRGGGEQSIRRSATEASIIAEGSQARAADKLAKFELVNAEVAKRMIQLAQQYMTEDEVIRINGQNGQSIWGHVEPDFIQGEFDFEVEAGSTKPKNEAYKMQQATQLFTALQPMLGTPFVNTPELLKFFIEQGFGIKDASKYVAAPQPQMIDPQTGQPLGDPMMAQQQAMEQQGQDQQQDPNAAPPQGVPPEVLQQLVGQVGFPQQGAIPGG